MHIYAFGSVCRGEIDKGSDIDMLVIVDGYDTRFDANDYSIYSYDRIQQIWEEGNPFAWHLHLESKLIFSDDKVDYVRNLSAPLKYTRGKEDCLKFQKIFLEAKNSYCTSPHSQVFDLSSMFLAIRNFATCYSLTMQKNPDFSRRSAIRLGSDSLTVSTRVFEQSRLLCTRAIGDPPTELEFCEIEKSFDEIENWMIRLIYKIEVVL